MLLQLNCISCLFTLYQLKMSLVVLERKRVKEIKTALEACGYYDNTRKVLNLNDRTDELLPPSCLASSERFALPITEVCSEEFFSFQVKGMPLPDPFQNCLVLKIVLPPSQRNIQECLHHSVLKLLKETILCDKKIDKMAERVPTSWERHGNLVILPGTSFSGDLWQLYFYSLSESQQSNFWHVVSESLKCKRLALGSKIADDSFRSPQVKLVLGEDGWVDHVDNGIHYMFDVTKCMFSSGNITEKIRLGNLDCRGETVVDLYAGIGYFVLPYLVHAGAELVHACEWNPDAVEALRKGLKANGVEDRCIVHFGDNKKAGLCGVADRVNVGLIPSSEEGWLTACTALKHSTGGWLHIHGNVTTKASTDCSDIVKKHFEMYSHLLSSKCLRNVSVTNWISYVISEVSTMLQQSEMSTSQTWLVEARHVEHVKSYAPHISHLVLDLECRPH